MNSLNPTSNNSGNYLADGETKDDFEKLKAYKIKNGTFYNGPFSTPRGNPEFGVFPFLGKFFFQAFILYYLTRSNYAFATYAIICYIIGCTLNGIRFYYVNTIANAGDDAKFINWVVIDNISGVAISLVALLFI